MSIKTITLAALLAAARPLAAHTGCGWHEKQVMAGGEGTVCDAETRSCVPKTTS